MSADVGVSSSALCAAKTERVIVSLGARIPGSGIAGTGLGGQDRDADALARFDVVRIV